ncbi:MAG: NAD(P)H-hydrate dehydratase [Candidatus Howiella sp.]|jgi:hydroxyethylthiazole kinase-like uncharacterized protein yjeF
MKILTGGLTRQAEERAVALGMEWLRLMENAGSAAAAILKKQYAPEKLRVCVLCGRGGNGGDGLVIARKLREAGAAVTVVLTSGTPTHPSALENFGRASALGIPMYDYAGSTAACLDAMREAALLVDAIFGIGFHGAPAGAEAAVIGFANSLKVPIAAVDLPSGAACDTGRVEGVCIRADLTVTFSTLKPCHVTYPAAGFCGRVVPVGIGMPDRVFEGLDAGVDTIDRVSVEGVCAPRRADAHKGDFGTPLLVCGSYGMAGAAGMAVKAALRSGAGIVQAAVPKSIYPILAQGLYEPVFLPLEEDGNGRISFYALAALKERVQTASALLLGPGLSRGGDVARVVRELLRFADCPVVLDADGINALAGRIDMIEDAKAQVVLTPHPGEMARLLGRRTAEVQADRVGTAVAAAKRSGAVILLKGARTVVATPDGRAYVNLTGNPGMATGGSGDALAGMLTAFLGRGIDPSLAARAAVYFHGAAGDLAAAELTETAMLPTDLIDRLPFVFSNNTKG